MSRYYNKAFADAARKLRREIPLGVPVRIETSNVIRGDDGDNLADFTRYFSGEQLAGFRIRILRGLSLDSAIDCLIHEYAHCVDYEQQPNPRLDHRESWGRCYAKCYQAVKGRH